MTSIRPLDDLLAESLEGTPVLVRVDFNVPRSGDEILDETRLRASLPTLEQLQEAGARTILVSHCGRPKGEPDPVLSLRPVARALADLLQTDVGFGPDCVGPVAAEAVSKIAPGGFCLLENLRFHAGETTNSEIFSTALAAHAELYVNDAFGCSHRAHASVVGVPRFARCAVGGRLLEAEIRAFEDLLSCRRRPFVAILGGAKISNKIDAIDAVLGLLDSLLIGGAMANTFLAASGYDLGASLVAQDEMDVARRILRDADRRGVDLRLPTDLVVTDRLRPGPGPDDRAIETVRIESVPAASMAVDLGPDTLGAYERVVRQAEVLFWNGPVGVFETAPFDRGGRRLAQCVAEARAFSVVGGGETVAAINQAGAAVGIDHISTGGGASLELVAGKSLPGIEVLSESRIKERV